MILGIHFILVFILSRRAQGFFVFSSPQSVVPCFTWVLDPNVLGSEQLIDMFVCSSRMHLYSYRILHPNFREYEGISQTGCVWPMLDSVEFWHFVVFWFALLRRRQLSGFYLGRANIGPLPPSSQETHPSVRTWDVPKSGDTPRSQTEHFLERLTLAVIRPGNSKMGTELPVRVSEIFPGYRTSVHPVQTS